MWQAERLPYNQLIQLRENFRVANICPFARELERFHFFTGLSEVADRIGQFVFAAWGRFQFCGEIENAWPKRVKAGVIPGARRFALVLVFREDRPDASRH